MKLKIYNHGWFLLLALIFALALACAYSNHFKNSFHFDDSHVIENNLSIRTFDIGKFFSDATTMSSLPQNQSYRPLFTTLIALEYWLYDGQPIGFHIIAFLIYIILWLLLFLLFNKIFSLSEPNGDKRIHALVASSFFMMHTANAETINYLSAQSDLLSTTLIVAGLVLYALKPYLRKVGFYIIPLVLAVFTKELSAIFALFLVLYIFYENSYLPKSQAKTIWQCLIASAPAIFFAMLALAFSSIMIPKSFHPSNIERWSYILAQPFVIVHYFFSFLLPFNLSADSDFKPLTNAFDTRILIGIAFIAFLLVTAFKNWQRPESRPISFGIWWFFIGVFPTSSGIVVLSEVMNDHRTFLPFIGLTLMFSSGAWLLIKQAMHNSYNGLALSMALIVPVMSANAYGVFQRNKVWRDEEHLWHDVTLKSPENGRGLMNYGLTLMAKGNIKEALSYFEKARVYTPNYSYLHINTAIAHGALGDKKKAESFFLKAIKANPNYHGGYFYYARFLNKENRHDEAILLLKKSIKIASSFADSRYLLMNIYQAQKEWDALKTLADDTLELWPNNPVATSLKQIALTALNEHSKDNFNHR